MLLCATIYNGASRALKGLIWPLALLVPWAAAWGEPAHGIAMHGSPRYGPDFKHLDYVNPEAPKGGRLILSALGSFDSLNPLIVKGASAGGLRGYVFESLMARAYDEPFSLYGLLAETVETPDDRSWVAFKLRAEARFSDGKPVTVDDVIFSHALLRDMGRPNHRFYYTKVAKIDKVGPRTVKFTFKPDGDREMPLIMGLMPVLPRHAFARDTFDQTSLRPPTGSGPYVVTKVDPGTSVSFRRNTDYWGRNLPVNKGRYNFDEVRYDYYRDTITMFEAFKKGLYDVRSETDPARWALGYTFPAAQDGRVKTEEFPIGLPSGMSALVFNTRRPLFADRRVRQALTLLFDFEWINKTLYHTRYARTQSYFDRSKLSSHGRPADAFERALLAPFADAIDPAVMDGSYTLPVSDGSGRNRSSRRKALKLLQAAGYVLKSGKLIHKSSGRPVAFEILVATKAQERLLLSYARLLKRVGIEARIRQVDSAQYQRRRQSYDFDMIQNFWSGSLSPGNEQSFRWSSRAADTEGTFNYAGVKSAAVDTMIAALLEAKNRAEFVSTVRSLDRVLLSGNYVIPLFHLPRQWVARWTRLRHPKTTSLYGFRLNTWWTVPEGHSGQAR